MTKGEWKINKFLLSEILYYQIIINKVNGHIYVLYLKISLIYDVSVHKCLAVCLVDSPSAGAQVKQSHVEQKQAAAPRLHGRLTTNTFSFPLFANKMLFSKEVPWRRLEGMSFGLYSAEEIR